MSCQRRAQKLSDCLSDSGRSRAQRSSVGQRSSDSGSGADLAVLLCKFKCHWISDVLDFIQL